MRALGLSSDEEIFKSICYKLVDLSEEEKNDLKGMLEIIRNSVEEITLTSKEECQKFIGEYLEKNKFG